MFYSTKTFGNERGLSCAFRQPRATHSHCSKVHGYSLGFKFVFKSVDLDERNWVYDFGNTKWIKKFLDDHFDHKLAVAQDDPAIHEFMCLEHAGAADLLIFAAVGCEAFARFVFEYVKDRVYIETAGRVTLKSVEVFEHGANSAIYEG